MDDDLTPEAIDALVDNLIGHTSTPIDWSRVLPGDAPQQWLALDSWVRRLAARYAIDHREIPPCWFHHWALVEELSALRSAHQSAFDPTGSAEGPADWHHTLAAARGRLRDWVARTGCRPSEHRDDQPQQWAMAGPTGDYQGRFARHVDTDTATRTDRRNTPP